MEIQSSDMIYMHDGQQQIAEHQHIQILQYLHLALIIIDGLIERTTI